MNQFIDIVKRGAASALYISGSALASYNITAFKTDKFGTYFRDDNQFWLAVGVALIVTGWAIRNWKKL
jgi:hypothetical protein